MKTMDRISNKLIENRWAMGVGIALLLSITTPTTANFFAPDPDHPAELSSYIMDSITIFISGLVGVFIAYKFIVPRKLCMGVSEDGMTLRVRRRSKILRWEDLEKIKIFERKGEVVSRIVVKPSGKRSFDIFHKEKGISLEAMIQEKRPINQNMEVVLPGWTKEYAASLIVSLLGLFVVIFLLVLLVELFLTP